MAISIDAAARLQVQRQVKGTVDKAILAAEVGVDQAALAGLQMTMARYKDAVLYELGGH